MTEQLPPTARPGLPSTASWFDAPASGDVVPPVARRRWDRFAVAALVLSLPGLAPPAVVLALVGLRRIRRSGARGRRPALAALALCGCWTIAIGVAVGLDVYGEQQAGIGRSSAIAEVGVGQCFATDLAVGTLHTVTVADCSDPHAGEVYAEVGAALTGLSLEATETAVTKQCATAFQRFVGRSYEASSLDMFYVVVADRTVADGNIRCLLGIPGENLTGSMRGTRR